MSYTVAQLEAQKQVTMQALGAGQITVEGYKQWMTAQDKLIAEARAREAAANNPQPAPSQPSTPPPASSSNATYAPNPFSPSGMGNPANQVSPSTSQPPTSTSQPSQSTPAASSPVIASSPSSPVSSTGMATGSTMLGYVNTAQQAKMVSETELIVSSQPAPNTGIVSRVSDFFGYSGGLSQSEGVFSALGKSSLATPKLGNNPLYAVAVGKPEENRVSAFVSGKEYVAAPVLSFNAPLLSDKEMKSVANNLLLVGAGTGLAAAPVAAGVGAGISLGVSQGVKTGTQLYRGEDLTLLSPSEAFYAGTSGAIFGGANSVINSGLGVALKDSSPWVREFARAGGNALVGGGLAGVTEVGMTGSTSAKSVATGAAIAGGINLGISGIQAAQPYIPKPTKGILITPTKTPTYDIKTGVWNDQTGSVVEFGLFKAPAERSLFGGMKDTLPTPIKGLTRTRYYPAENPSTVNLLLGRGGTTANIPKNTIITYNVGTAKGFQPTTALQTSSTVRTMEKLVYGASEISLVRDLRSLAAPIQGIKVNPATTSLPSETLTLNPAGMTAFKDLVASNSKNIRLFGSSTLQPQLSEGVSYTVPNAVKGGAVEVSNRLPMDIDVQFSGSPAEAEKFVSDIVQLGKETGNPLSVSSDSPYLIMGVNRETGMPAHAFDIKVSGVTDSGMDSSSSAGLLWGFEQNKPAAKIEGLPVQRLDEQINRLGFDSVLNFNADKTLSPVAHRKAKDTIRALHALESAYSVKGVDITGDPRFVRTMEYFGVKRDEYFGAPRMVEFRFDVGSFSTGLGSAGGEALGVKASGGSSGSGTGSGGSSVGGSGYDAVVGGRSDRYKVPFSAVLGDRYPSAAPMGSGGRSNVRIDGYRSGGSSTGGSSSSSGGAGSSSGGAGSGGSVSGGSVALGSSEPSSLLNNYPISNFSGTVVPSSANDSFIVVPPTLSPEYPNSSSPSGSYRSSGYTSDVPSPSSPFLPYSSAGSLLSGLGGGSMFDRRVPERAGGGRRGSKSKRKKRTYPVASVDKMLKRVRGY